MQDPFKKPDPRPPASNPPDTVLIGALRAQQSGDIHKLPYDRREQIAIGGYASPTRAQ